MNSVQNDNGPLVNVLVDTSITSHTSEAAERTKNWWLVAGDALSLIIAWSAALGLLWLVERQTWRAGLATWWGAVGVSRAAMLAALFGTTLVILMARGHYSRRRPFADETLDIIKVFMVMAIIDALLSYLTKGQFSRAWFTVAWILSVLLLPMVRALVKRWLIRARLWHRTTVIVGVGINAREAAEALNGEPLMGLEIIAFLSLPDDSTSAATLDVGGKTIPILPIGSDPSVTLEQLGSPQIVVALEAESLLPHQKLLQRLSARYADMSIIPPLRGLPLYGMEMTHFFSHEVLMLTVRNNLARPGPRFVKRLFDLVVSLSLLVLLAPLFAYFSWKIRLTGGDAIFGHLRIGQHGRPFFCLKFRTMVPNATQVLEEVLARDPSARAEWEQNFKLKNDPRITRIGAFLRESSLDELPQLWNVLKGEMSLVGPRPIIEEELERYGEQVGYYLEARPGMTGLWQISGRNDTGYEDRVALDCWYVRNWSLWYDLVVLVKTIRVVLGRHGAY
jgi:Undecaprenyl-phosphate galactose phosphotransferase WbaP